MEIIKNKWIAAVASIWIQCTSGSLYTFSIYSPVLKSSQGYDQSTLDTVSVFKDIGANAGILSGLLYSTVAVPQGRRFYVGGPWIVLLGGAIQCFAGYFLMWLSVTGILSRPPVSVMCLYMFMAAHAQSFFNTADVVTAVHNFRDYSGTIVGIMKGFVGLSGAILVQVYQLLFQGDPTSFILMLALLPTINPLLLMYFVRAYNTRERDEKKHLNYFSVVSLLIASYLMVIIILNNILFFQSSARIATFVPLLLLLASPLCVAVKARQSTSMMLSTYFVEKDPLIDTSNSSDADKLNQDDDVNLCEALRTSNFWFLFLAMACGMGSGLATVNNISQIGESLGYKSFETSTLVSLWSIWNFLGRFGGGYVSDYFMHVRKWPRPLFMAITLAAMSIGHAIIAFGMRGSLYIGSILVGVCYGSQWSLMPTITSEIFSLRHMGTIFNTISIASPLGSYILSVRVVGQFYDKEAIDEGGACIGRNCFMPSFLIMAGCTLLGSFVAILLFFRTRNFYNLVIIRRLDHLG